MVTENGWIGFLELFTATVPCVCLHWHYDFRFDKHLNKYRSCVSKPFSNVYNTAFIANQHRCPQPQGSSHDLFGSAQPWEIHAHKEWHLERRASIGLMLISKSHCGWWREQALNTEWTADTGKSWVTLVAPSPSLFGRQLITALNNACNVKPCF